MSNKKCQYASTCPVFFGALKDEDKPSFIYRNVFCNRGSSGWNACKRFQVYELGIEPPKELLPGSKEKIESFI